MVNTMKKYLNLYIFILIITITGLIFGLLFYSFLNKEIKLDIINNYNITNELTSNTNLFKNNIIFFITIFISSISIIGLFIILFKIFYESFCLGFIIKMFSIYKFKFNIIYITLYYLIPLIFKYFIIIISIRIIYREIRLLFDIKNPKRKRELIKCYKKIIIIFIIQLIYDLIIFLYSGFINNYLVSIL